MIPKAREVRLKPKVLEVYSRSAECSLISNCSNRTKSVNSGISDISPDPEPIRVLQVIDTLGMGGAETWLMDLLRLWSPSGLVRMDFLLTSGNLGLFDEEARRLGARLHYLKYSRPNLREFFTRFRNILREERYDVVHDHQDYASGWHFLLASGTMPRIRVTHVHNPWLHIETNYSVNVTRKLIARAGKYLVKLRAAHVCGTSRDALKRYGFNPDVPGRPKVSVVHCGINVDKFGTQSGQERASVLREFEWASDAKIVLFAGRLDAALDYTDLSNHKNSWLALNIARAAIDKQANVRLLMAGAGDASRRAMERHILQWGLGDRLRLIGVRTDMPRLMAAADLLLFPSRQEGLGMVAVEAQASGLPVLASTAVPRECVVVPELYNTMSLQEPIGHWAAVLLQILDKSRPPLEECRRAVQKSEFNIVNSARRLLDIYGSARR